MEGSILSAILAVFTAIGDWMVETIPTFFGLFYTAGSGLTILGTLAVVGLGIGLIFLLIGVIQNFMHFRG